MSWSIAPVELIAVNASNRKRDTFRLFLGLSAKDSGVVKHFELAFV